MVDSFCHLGGMLSAGGICELVVTACVKTALKEFNELLPVFISHEARDHVYGGPCYMPMKPWTLTKTSLQRLRRNDRVMIRQICNIKPENEVLAKIQLEALDLI